MTVSSPIVSTLRGLVLCRVRVGSSGESNLVVGGIENRVEPFQKREAVNEVQALARVTSEL